MEIRKFIKKYKVACSLTLLLAFVHFFIPFITSSKIQPIKGDAQGYYAYLPAIFIYQDLEFTFVNEINEKYYTPNDRKSFLVTTEEFTVNKTFPGAAVYYLPGFLIAHGITLISGAEADGYSSIYQISFDVFYWLYLFLALLFLHKVLALLKFKTSHINLVLITIVLGTNIFFYSIFNQSVTHIFNFLTINVILYCFIRFSQNDGIKFFLYALPLLALLGVTRPTNILVFLVIPVFIEVKPALKNVWQHLQALKNIPLIVLPSVLILSIPLILWKVQTGNWIVYSYGEEGFNFGQPEMLNFTFSYIKGWFTYTPLALIIIVVGSILLFKINKNKSIRVIAFYMISIYVFSSWWCWYYGAGQSQRVMIDFSVVLAYLLSVIFSNFPSRKIVMIPSIVLAVFLMSTNIIQAFQIYSGILPHGSPTKAQYWDNFFSLDKKARVYPYEHWEQHQDYAFNLIKGQDVIKGNSYEVEGSQIIQVAEFEAYSGNIQLPEIDINKHHKLVISFEARARTAIELTRAILDFNGSEDAYVFGLNDYLIKDEWTLIEFKYESLEEYKGQPLLYFWNAGSSEKVEFKNIGFTIYYSEEYM